MKINKQITTTVIMNEQDEIISTRKSSSYLIYPEQGKMLKNKMNGYTTGSCIGISSKSDLENFEEIDNIKE